MRHTTSIMQPSWSLRVGDDHICLAGIGASRPDVGLGGELRLGAARGRRMRPAARRIVRRHRRCGHLLQMSLHTCYLNQPAPSATFQPRQLEPQAQVQTFPH